MKLKKVYNGIFLVGMAMWIAIFGVLIIVREKERFSYDENRMLSEISLSDVAKWMDGTMLSELDSYCMDHAPSRKRWLTFHALAELLQGKRESNGVMLCQDDRLIARAEYLYQTKNDSQDYELTNIAKICERYDKSHRFCIAPQSFDLYAESCGMQYDQSSLSHVWNNINNEKFNLIDLREILCEKIEQGVDVWYRTDHHWTSFGAYEAYAAYLRSLGMTPYALSDFHAVRISRSFFGTQYSASGFFWVEPDSVTLLRWQGDENIVVKNAESEGGLFSLYDMSAIEKKDQYAVFLGGNFSHLSVYDPTDDDKPRLTLIKDSFANSVIPLLARHFQIEVYDPRFMSESVEDVISRADSDLILVLCGIDSVAIPK